MQLNEYIACSEALLAEAAKIETAKRPAYTANSEVLSSA